MTARTRPKPRAKLGQLADHAYNAMHCPDEANRIEAVTELLNGLGAIGQSVARYLCLPAPRKKRKPVDGEIGLPFRRVRVKRRVTR